MRPPELNVHVVNARRGPGTSDGSPGLPRATAYAYVLRCGCVRLHAEYATAVDRESARETLEGAAASAQAGGAGEVPGPGRAPAKPAKQGQDDDEEPTLGEQLGKALGSPAGKTLQRELVRGLFGVLGLRTTVRRRRRRGLF